MKALLDEITHKIKTIKNILQPLPKTMALPQKNIHSEFIKTFSSATIDLNPYTNYNCREYTII